MCKYAIAFIILICMLVCINLSVADAQKLIDNTRMASVNHVSAVFTLPPDTNKSVLVKIIAYNGDPVYRRTVHFDIDGIGCDIAYGMTNRIPDGYVPPKKTRSWFFNLSRTYHMVVRKFSSYSLVENKGEEADVNYMDILRKPGEHRINCWVNASDKFAPQSKISIEVMSSPEPKKINYRPQSTVIIADDSSDIRMKLVLDKLRSVTDYQQSHNYIYIIGKEKSRQYVDAGELSSLGSDGYLLKTVIRDGRRFIVVAGNYTTGIAYGVIQLVRIIDSAPDRLQNLNISAKPAYPLRVMYEERPWCNRDDAGSYKYQLQRYFEEGINIADIWSAPLEPDSRYTKNYTYTRPYGDLDTFNDSVNYAHTLGIKTFVVQVCQSNPLLDVPKENIAVDNIESLYSVTLGGGHDPSMLCLSDPLAVDILKSQLAIACRTLKNIDGFVPYFADPGGCWCSKCRPWGKTIIRTLNDIYAPVIRETNPKLKVVLSLWGVDFDDIKYVVDHIDELPDVVTAIQIPPTSMIPGKYMTLETRIPPVVAKASKHLPVILQQFYDGVGFKDAWVDIWEHPMPESIRRNLQACDSPHGIVKGTYGSAFRLSDQLVDLRLSNAWAWDPDRSARDIMIEFGNEHFGIGTGTMFADAMSSLEIYWSNEARRFLFDVSNISEFDIETMQESLRAARNAEFCLRKVEGRVTRNKLYYKGFTDLAELTRSTVEANILLNKSQMLSESGKADDARSAVVKALALSERVLDIMNNSDRYSWLTNHPWWKNWSIGKRPDAIRRILDIMDKGYKQGLLPLDDPSFGKKDWKQSGSGMLEYVSDTSTGNVSAKLTVGSPMDYVEIHPSESLTVVPGVRYKIAFKAKVLEGTPALYLDLSSDDVDGVNSDVQVAADNDWHSYSIYVQAPDAPAGTPMSLRFVAHVNAQVLMLDDVSIYGPVAE